MKVEIISAAEEELKDSVRYYNNESEGLGYEFALEIERTIERIVQYPEAWVEISNNIRRCRCKRFPYGVIYQREDDLILIIAVMHLHRKPDSWKDRKKKP